MTPSEIAALAIPIYGPRWQSPLARDMAVAIRTVQRWARGGIERQATADAVRRFLEERRRTFVGAPPPEGDRDAAAYAEFAPRVGALVAAGEQAGWHPAETLTAVLTSAVEMMRAGAGADAAAETLQQALDGLRT